VFVIYRPERIARLGEMLEYWRTRAREHGIEDMHFIGVVAHRTPRWNILRHLDAFFLFQPFVATFDLQESEHLPGWKYALNIARYALPLTVQARINRVIDDINGPTHLDYDRVWQQIIQFKSDRAIKTYEGAFVDWDNTARYERRAKIYTAAS